MKSERNYLENIYDIIDSEDTSVDDNGVTILDDDEDYDYNSLYEPEWGEEVEFLDSDESGDECYLEELGDGFIPLPQGDVEVDVVVIDEDYSPDEYEVDVCEGYNQNEIEVLDELVEDGSEIINVGDEMSGYKNKEESTFDNEIARLHNATVEDSVINTPETETLAESMGVNDDPDTDKIAKSIAKEHMDRMSEQSALPGEETSSDIEKGWIHEDMFGNDIGSIIADVSENIDIEDDDYIEGSFKEWADAHGVAL